MKYLLLLALAACGGEQKQPPPAAPVANQPSGSAVEEQRLGDEHRREMREAPARAREAKAKLDQAEAELELVSAKLDAAVDAVASAQNDSDRQAAVARLRALQNERDAAKQRVEQAKAANDDAQRALPVHTQDYHKCMDNPLAEGCT